MTWLENVVAQIVRSRGLAGVWELAAVAAIAPYIIGSSFTGWTYGTLTSSPYASAASLVVTLFFLAALRTALTTMCGGASYSNWMAISAVDLSKTLRTSQRAPNAQPDRSALTGLPVRDTLRTIIDGYDRDTGPAALGLVRFANCSAMAAFNAAAARRVMSAFGRRFEGAVGDKRPIAQIDDDSFAIWFAGREAQEVAEGELRSIAYVLSQEIEDEALTVAPDIQLASAWISDPDDTFLTVLGRARASLVPLKRLAQAEEANLGKPAAESLAERFALEQALRRAVREGQLSLRYQPFVDVAEGRVTGAEVLVRWRHPELGDVSPTRFVPLLEETGLIHEIGLWTLNSACRQLSEWRAAGQQDLRLAINLSAVQLQSRTLRATIERTVAAHGLLPGDVELELTETAAMEDRVRTTELFHELRALGYGIAIDDFGSGHSNLSYLKNLPFTKLKIDREFTVDVDNRTGSQAICKALIELGEGLAISVLAEGVERYAEVATLRRLGCRFFQGFYFAQPLTAEELTARLADPDWLALIKSDVHRGRAELQKRMVS